MLIAMAGLPATGKSVIARQLAGALAGVVLDKDSIRAALFPPALVEYSREQDDFCLGVIYQVAAYLLRKHPRTYVLLDGRTFSRRYQVDQLLAFAAEAAVELKVVECVCADDVARRRLEGDRTGRHIAANRDYRLYQELKARAEPLQILRLVLNTDEGDVEAYVRQALHYIRDQE